MRRTTTVAAGLAAAALAATALAAPASASNARSSATLWHAVQGTDALSTLEFAITASDATQGTDYIGALSDRSAYFTVFAPTNEAFEKVADELFEEKGLGDGTVGTLATYLVTEGLLDEVLAYHVAAADRPAASLVKRAKNVSIATLLAGASLTVTPQATVRDAAPSTSDAGIAAADIRVANGRVHVITNVLVPLAI